MRYINSGVNEVTSGKEYKDRNILVISEVFYPEIGSGANRITNLVCSLVEEGYNIDLITSEPSYPEKQIYINDKFTNKRKESDLSNHVNVLRVKGSKFKSNDNLFLRAYIYIHLCIKIILKVIFSKKKYDLVIATVPSLFMGLVGVIAKKKYRCKFILDIRDLWPECIKNIGSIKKHKLILKVAYKMEKILLNNTDSLVVNSEGFISYLKGIGYSKEIRYIPNGLKVNELDDYYNTFLNTKKHTKFTVVYAGLIGLAQNIESIVNVANYLKLFDNINLKIIGTGVEKKKIVRLIEKYDLKNIEVVAPIPKSEVIEEVSKCHIALANLRNDSVFGLVTPGKLIDYMGIGIPIIAGVEGYTANLIKKSGAGIVVEPDNYINMANSIVMIYTNYNLAKLYSENGHKFCNKNFCWERNFKQYNTLIERVLEIDEGIEENMHVRMELFHK